MAEEIKEEQSEQREDVEVRRSPFFTRRRAGISVGILAILGVLLALFTVVSYRYGVFDNYVKGQFRAKMADIGVDFDADVLRVTVSPLRLELRNATFNDRVNGEKLFFIRQANLDLTVQDLYAWQLTRDISIDRTEIVGAEAWVVFDENGNSNFRNLKLVEDERGSAVNFKYDTVELALSESVVHFGDLSRRISANGRNIVFSLKPETLAAPGDDRRYGFDLSSTESNFIYEDRPIENINLRVVGTADKRGAEFRQFDLKTPIGETAMTGTLIDWANPRYALDIQSTVDLTQASDVLPFGTPIVGVGNFKGRVSGEGESYKVEGEVFTESLRASGVSLKGANVTATVTGMNDSYEADGTAMAQLLTFDDFRVDMLKLAGNVRGTGTDFRWVGELQAAAAKSGSLSLGGLFLSDALAEYKDKQLRAEAASGRAREVDVGAASLDSLTARNLKVGSNNGVTTLSAGSADVGALAVENVKLNGLTGSDLRIKAAGSQTDVSVRNLRSRESSIADAKLRGLTADEFSLTDRPASTNFSARNLKAERVDQQGIRIDGVDVPVLEAGIAGSEVTVYADKLRLAKVDAGSALLGSLNIGGVRLSIRQGRVEARSNDINAGNVTLAKSASLPGGGQVNGVKLGKPVFILEPSGRYRATADMTLGGGLIGSIDLGAASARVEAANDRITLTSLNAQLMDGRVDGSAIIGLNRNVQSRVDADFSSLDISKLLALSGGQLLPVNGQTTGSVDLIFSGTDLRNASGSVNAGITANAGTADRGLIPVNGQVRLNATNGLFNVDAAELNTEKSKLTATGRFDLRDENSDLTLALRSTDANEIDRMVRVLGVSPELEEQLNSLEIQIAGNLNFDGTVRGNLRSPTVEGRASLDSIALRGRQVGSVATEIFASPVGVELRNGKLNDGAGGSADFSASIPSGGANNIAVKADLRNINAGNLLGALPITLPERIRDFTGQTSGTVDITGLPNAAQGQVNLAAARGTIAGQQFDNLNVNAVFNGPSINVERAEIRFGEGSLTAKGLYDRTGGTFNFDLGGQAVPASLVTALFSNAESIPQITGDINFTATATGIAEQTSSYNVQFNGAASNVKVGENQLGQIAFKGVTANSRLTADVTAVLDGRPQVINAELDFANENLPFKVTTEFNQSPLTPFIAFVPQLKDVALSGVATGRVEFGGNLSNSATPGGQRTFSADQLSGQANFSQLALQIQDTPLSSVGPVVVRFNTRELVFEQARFAGGGTNMTVAGTKALSDDAINNLSIDGRVNLSLINPFIKDTFFAGFAETSVRFAGPNATAMATGTANLVNASVATFLGTDRFTADRLNARIIFTTNQVEIESATGLLGGGRFTGSGGGTLKGFAIQTFRFTLDGNNVTVPIPKDFVTTGDARLEITAIRPNTNADLQLTIGGRVYARRALYSRDIDLASLISGRSDQSLSSGGGSSLNPVRFDIVIEGRDALVVKNNIADLTASLSLALSGDANEPRVSGRITANSGTVLFRKDRYVVERAVVEFPPDTAVEPVVNLQAETEIAGYQIFVNLSGPLKDSEQLTATVRSSPALPQADVVSLITTGNLTNSAGGIPTLASTGINTAAEILTDAIINEPIRKATDQLFGLNVFEIDPLISGQTANPGARLTVGRQINNNLRVTYSTNLSQDQNQVLALEYRVSNKLSFVAQYEQRSLSNVTRNRDNFSFEIRFRKRF